MLTSKNDLQTVLFDYFRSLRTRYYGFAIRTDNRGGVFSDQYRLNIMVQYDRGYPWEFLGVLTIRSNGIKLDIKTVLSVLRSQCYYDVFDFPAADPEFPQNVVNFIGEASRVAKKVKDLKIKRTMRNFAKTKCST